MGGGTSLPICLRALWPEDQRRPCWTSQRWPQWLLGPFSVVPCYCAVSNVSSVPLVSHIHFYLTYIYIYHGHDHRRAEPLIPNAIIRPTSFDYALPRNSIVAGPYYHNVILKVRECLTTYICHATQWPAPTSYRMLARHNVILAVIIIPCYNTIYSNLTVIIMQVYRHCFGSSSLVFRSPVTLQGQRAPKAFQSFYEGLGSYTGPQGALGR